MELGLAWAMFGLVALLALALVAGSVMNSLRWQERTDRDAIAIKAHQDQLLLFMTDDVASRRMDRDNTGKAAARTVTEPDQSSYDPPQSDMHASMYRTDEGPG